MTHTQDSDCSVDPATDLCAACGAHHGEPCASCKGRVLHAADCATVARIKAREAAWREWPAKRFYDQKFAIGAPR